jgi:1-acylglycerone phosphate reductase
MELRPLGVRILLLSPGFVQTNIGVNQAGTILPRHSLYGSFKKDIDDYVNHTSHAAGATPSEEAAEKIATTVLARNNLTYFTLAKGSTLVSFLSWLPRAFVLTLVWKQFTQKSRGVAVAQS